MMRLRPTRLVADFELPLGLGLLQAQAPLEEAAADGLHGGAVEAAAREALRECVAAGAGKTITRSE